jgi:hypothetical protein
VTFCEYAAGALHVVPSEMPKRGISDVDDDDDGTSTAHTGVEINNLFKSFVKMYENMHGISSATNLRILQAGMAEKRKEVQQAIQNVQELMDKMQASVDRQVEAAEVLEIVQQFQSADTDAKQQEATKKVDTFLATSDNSNLVFDTILMLRKTCVEKNMGQTFNQWRVSFMQRAERDKPTPEELPYVPYKTKAELMTWLQDKLDSEAPKITAKEVMSEAMGAWTASERRALSL